MVIRTTEPHTIKLFLRDFFIPKPDSHKGQNGKVMVIGGSALFHSALIWSAEVASYFADMVHFCSTEENNEIVTAIKKKWRNGIVVPQRDMFSYIEEDDAVLLGTGMMRNGKPEEETHEVMDPEKIFKLQEEGERTYRLTKYLLEKFPEKRWVIDAGSLQMMDKEWLVKLKTKPVLTPHQKEFAMLFGTDVSGLDREGKIKAAAQAAKNYNCVILMKAGYDIVTDGDVSHVIEGGNAGLTKGGTGDILAGLTLSFYAKNKPVDACVAASYLLKKTAEVLSEKKGYWYNNADIISCLSSVLLSSYKSIPGLTDPL